MQQTVDFKIQLSGEIQGYIDRKWLVSLNIKKSGLKCCVADGEETARKTKKAK